MSTHKKSALTEQEGISGKEITNADSILKIKKKRQKQPNATELYNALITGNISALSKAITLIESTHPDHNIIANSIINLCLPHANNSIRVGITGVPGAGKSTFIEALGNHVTTLNKKVAVLTVDPTSSVTKGSILGDKTRMEELAKNPNAYIRPSASGETLGGVARKTRETIILCEAAGFDTIIIETVGVGQSETVVHNMVDFFLLIKIAGAGDELQGIKRGIIELADAIVINKADGDNIEKAKLAKLEFSRALHLFKEKTSGWIPKVNTCSALHNEGIKTVWETINTYITHAVETDFFNTNRTSQNTYWLKQTIETTLIDNFYNNSELINALQEQLELIKNNKTTPYSAASFLLSIYHK